MISALPLDIFLKILDYSDQGTKYNMGLTCHFLSLHAFQKLWTRPTIVNITSLSLLATTLWSETTYHPYKEWIKELSIHMVDTEHAYELVPDSFFIPLSTLNLKTLSLQRVGILPDSVDCSDSLGSSFKEFLHGQLSKKLIEFNIYQCAPSIIYSLVEATRINKIYCLRSLDIRECSMEDNQLEYLAKFYPNLRELRLYRCGCFSDQGLIAVARHCQDIQTLIVTLPSYFVQSNTITTKTINALALNCPKLQRFVCEGQIRILEYIKEPQNHTFSIVTSI